MEAEMNILRVGISVTIIHQKQQKNNFPDYFLGITL